MHYSAIVFSLLASTGALAAPYYSTLDNSIKVVLGDLAGTYADLEISFTEGMAHTVTPSFSGPFSTVALQLGNDVVQQDLRCKVVDDAGNDIVVVRGNNTDVTFSDAAKGAWTLPDAAVIGNVICDPEFEKITPEELAAGSTLRVVLQSQALELGSQTELTPGWRDEQYPIGSNGPFETVELRVGKFVAKKDYRCQILDTNGNAIMLQRGAASANTFSDQGKGEWSLDFISSVSSIICDPTFVKEA
ncbi:uncharacterized protein A1O9_09822 [Exophiala aquamarina CBS 119918]|uniref:Ubiquitin 3 binding protein But2 C-terminal domain-containing protein n=1 Tax=Exophiala aquamarina CBS 119918 TaxID=1182545 RepID=A0A072P2V0_9EURO|nr:uncharacterized protein A1O9_09822 [Exophiala aquamarina CBS 119918]KEF54027.1 hypothetical protein A1O9_09822 [Exophiala aquamarina CBS 119918]